MGRKQAIKLNGLMLYLAFTIR